MKFPQNTRASSSPSLPLLFLSPPVLSSSPIFSFLSIKKNHPGCSKPRSCFTLSILDPLPSREEPNSGGRLRRGDLGFIGRSGRDTGREDIERERERADSGRMVSLAARQGRQLQRYSSTGGRLVVGCIPYKFDVNCSSSDLLRSMEVLVISSQKGYGMMFPKGGWESDETIKQAALREALEEAGVQGNIERRLGKWKYKSSTQAVNEGIVFPLNVTEELVHWPEMSVRQRRWVSVAEAREGCKHPWMREALDRLVRRLSSSIRRRMSASAS